jgi:hypothetical protein
MLAAFAARSIAAKACGKPFYPSTSSPNATPVDLHMWVGAPFYRQLLLAMMFLGAFMLADIASVACMTWEGPVGEHLKYLIKVRGQAIACLAWSSAPRHLASRDRFIGWDQAARRRNLHLIACNMRFLILP